MKKLYLEEFEVPVNDGAQEKYIKQREEQKEKDIKEDNKEFAAREKIANEINVAKPYKVKELVGKLTLAED